MNHWLLKSEPDTYSWDNLLSEPQQTCCWDGIRNYQARNFMRDSMKLGDPILFYHSRCKTPAIIGLAQVVKESYPDYTSWDPQSPYFDPKSTPDNPRWFMVDIQATSTLPSPHSLTSLKSHPPLSQMKLVQPGQRLSVQPVTPDEFNFILSL